MLSFAEGILAFLWLLSFPTNRQTYSLFRLTALVILLVISTISAAAFLYVRSQKEPFKFSEQSNHRKGRILLSFLLITVSLLLWTALLFKDQWLSYTSASTYARLVPIVLYGLLLCLQTGIFLLTTGQNKDIVIGEVKSIGKPTLVLWGIFLATWLLVWVSRIGLIHDAVGLNWGPPGTPVTFAQVNLVFVISFLLTFGFLLIKSRLRNVPVLFFSASDMLIFLALWGSAVVLWWNQPMSPTHFTPPPMPPNHEYYPYSDALIFDRASYHLLYGIGFTNQLVRRPLYAGLLAFFHKVAGANYEDTIFLQILLLALIPGLVFLVTSRLSNRFSGLLAGGLIVLREKNAIELSGEIVTSHAKLMMSDMLTLLGIVLFLYVTVKLLFQENRSGWQLAIAGACLGLVALVRTQGLILTLPLLLFIFLSKRPLRLGFKASAFTLLGLVLVLSPWIWRNWNLTGTFVLDDRGEERLLARNYSLTPVALPPPRTGETQEQFSARLKRDIVTFVVEHPTQVLFFISNHFFRNMVTSALYVAPTYSVDSPATTIEHLPFWGEWDGTLTPVSRISIFINLAILAAGISAAGTKNKYAGWFPLIAFLSYSLGNAIVRSSGWRFSLPIDWILLVYYSIGLAYLPSRIKLWFYEDVPHQAGYEKALGVKMSISRTGILALLVLLGASVPIAERLVHIQNYDHLTQDAKVDLSVNEVVSSAEINTFLEQKDAVLISGIALYPLYVRPNSRISIANAPQADKFLYLWLINEGDYQIILPLQNSPTDIPHTAILSVIGCREGNFISALAVIVHEPAKQILIRDPNFSLTCPLPVQP